MSVGEPLRAGVVEVRQRPFPERLRSALVAWDRALRVPRNGLVDPLDPLDPFGRIQPAVAQLDQPSGFQGFRWDVPVNFCNVWTYSVSVNPSPSLHPSF